MYNAHNRVYLLIKLIKLNFTFKLFLKLNYICFRKLYGMASSLFLMFNGLMFFNFSTAIFEVYLDAGYIYFLLKWLDYLLTKYFYLLFKIFLISEHPQKFIPSNNNLASKAVPCFRKTVYFLHCAKLCAKSNPFYYLHKWYWWFYQFWFSVIWRWYEDF